METATAGQPVLCSQCGGELHPDEGQIFLVCPFCSSTVYLDKSQVVFHWYLAPTLDEGKALGSLRRWMAGSQTVKDLDEKSHILETHFEYFPVWYFKRSLPGGKDQMLLELASASSVSELKHINLPAGDLRKYDPDLDAQSHPPNVPLDAAMSWLEGRGVPASELVEKAIVHIPLYTFKYGYSGKTYTAIVEGGTGSVFANIFPAKAEAPYILAGGVSALVFLCLATFPPIGAMIDGSSGAMVGASVCSVAGLVAAPILFGLAAWVAAKI